MLNISLEEVVCHGITSSCKILRTCMKNNVDIWLENGGYIDAFCEIYCIGKVTTLARRLAGRW